MGGKAHCRDRISAGFQDFAKFEFVAQETVGVGRLDSIDDSALVLAALNRAAGADVVDDLPRGLTTQLGHSPVVSASAYSSGRPAVRIFRAALA